MPLPDADKKSPRVYTNLQNLDLDNVTFANIQATGNPIAVEEMNEDEMRRLVLVNLARLVTAGEWTGLLDAGGGGDFNPVLPNQAIEGSSAANIAILNGYPPWGNGNNAAAVLYGNSSGNKIYLYPFVAPSTITVSNLEINITSAAASTCLGLMAFYSDSNGAPGTLIGKTSVDVESTGVKVLTAFLDSAGSPTDVDLTIGTQYWFGFGRNTDSVAYSYSGTNSYARPMVSFTSAPSFSANSHQILRTISETLAMPTSFTMTDLEPHSLNSMTAGIN